MSQTPKPKYIAETGATADVVGSWIDILGQRHVSFHLAWSGSSPVGPFVIEVTNDGDSKHNGAGFAPTGTLGPVALTLPSDLTPYFPGGGSDAGKVIIDVTTNARAIRLSWDRTSGTINLGCGFVAKE